jgi:hypothetical protein
MPQHFLFILFHSLKYLEIFSTNQGTVLMLVFLPIFDTNIQTHYIFSDKIHIK